MANSAISPAYALNLTLILDKYYNTPKGIGFDICMVLSSQMIGYGFAGLCRRFLVWPAGMIWPSNLVICTLLNTFHAEDDDGRDGSMTRYRFFAIVTTAAFAWYFLPNFLFTALSFFSWVCWIWPDNIVVNQLFGTWTGLGMGLLTFDWGQIAYIGSPLIVPWWAIMNVFVGFVFFYWFLTPILYYANVRPPSLPGIGD
jgi:OPT family oligopeptide transporter